MTNTLQNTLPTFEEYWKAKAVSNKLTREDFIVRALVKAIRAKNHSGLMLHELTEILLQKYFTPVINETKLNNGRKPYDAIWHGFQNVIYSINTTNVTEKNTHYVGTKPLEFQISDEELAQMKEIIKTLKANSKLDESVNIPTHVYTFVREDISPVQQAVQAGHSLLKLGKLKAGNGMNPDETYLILCEAYNEDDLMWIQGHLTNNDIDYVDFREPDMHNELTAISTVPVSYKQRQRFFRQFNKLVI